MRAIAKNEANATIGVKAPVIIAKRIIVFKNRLIGRIYSTKSLNALTKHEMQSQIYFY